MKKQRIVEDDRLIVTRFGGRHTYADAAFALDELSRINPDPEQIYELIVHDDDFEIDFTEDETRRLFDKVQETFSRFERGALAIVAAHDLVFGMSRMLEASIAHDRIAIDVFRSQIDARRWLEQVRASQKAAAKS